MIFLTVGCGGADNSAISNTSASQANANTAQPANADLLGTWIRVDDPKTKLTCTADEMSLIKDGKETKSKYTRLSEQEIEIIESESGKKFKFKITIAGDVLTLLAEDGQEVKFKRESGDSSDTNAADNTSANKAELEKKNLTDIEAQNQTMADIRKVSGAMFSWLTDQVGWNIYPKDMQPRSSENSVIRASLKVRSRDAQNVQIERLNYIPIQSKSPVDMKNFVRISYEDLNKVLHPSNTFYIEDIPEKDGWGHPYEFYMNRQNPLAEQVLAIRSPGRDGKYQSSTAYQLHSFSPDNFDEDIVWADGFFVQWPEKQPES